MAATNFSATPNGSILIACILLPLNTAQIEMLEPVAKASEKQVRSMVKSRQSEWTFMPFGLWQYRCGNDDLAIQWCQRALAQSQKFPSCEAALHATLAMVYFDQGQTNEAGAELAQARQLVDAKFKSGLDHGRAGIGFWFDWIYARHLLQEASALIDRDSAQPATE